MAASYKVESGLQLLARLTKRPQISAFYPEIFVNGPWESNIIEICGEPNVGKSLLLIDFIAKVISPVCFGGSDSGVILLLTDGNFALECLVQRLLILYNQADLNVRSGSELIEKALDKLIILNVYGSSQLQITIKNLETILSEHTNISLVLIDTLTAFYWCEQITKISKMESYIEKYLKLLQKVIKQSKVILMYTRPSYFRSKHDGVDSLKPCSKMNMQGEINYRITLQANVDGSHDALVESFEKSFYLRYEIVDGIISWN